MIKFGSGGKYAMVTASRYANFDFSIFTWGYLLVILVSFYLSLSTIGGTNNYMAALGATESSLGLAE